LDFFFSKTFDILQEEVEMWLIILPRLRYWFVIIAVHLFTPLVSYASEYMGVNTPHFRFYFHARDERLMGSLIDQAEGLRREVIEALGIDFEDKTKVYLAPSLRRFQEIQPRGEIPLWSVAVAYPSLNLIIIKSPRAVKRGHIDLGKVFKHEFTHIAVGRAFKGKDKAPRWLNEGLAMYVSREWNLSRVSTITRAVLTDSLIPLSEIIRSFPQDPDRAELAYSEGFYLISFLISRYGKESFHRFIKVYSGGKGLNEVLMEVYGIGWEELEEEWRDYLKLRFSRIPIITSTTALWFLITIAFILAYLRKRRATRLKLEELEREDEEL
jgi:hypothetical protein